MITRWCLSILICAASLATAPASAVTLPPLSIGDDPSAASPAPFPVDAHQVLDCPQCSRARLAIRKAQWAEADAAYQASIETGLLDQTDVLNYQLDLEVVPSQARLIGTNVMTVNVIENGVTTFDFRLATALVIGSVLFDGAPATWARQTAPNVRVTLPRIYNAGEQFTLTVAYNGIPVDEGFGSINFTTQSGTTLVFSLSEPYYSHTWWPIKDDNRDKATGQMNIVVPNTLTVAANGKLVGTDTVTGNKKRFRWDTDYPTAPYLFCFSATNYAQFSDTWTYSGGTMPLQFFIYPNSNTANNRNAWLKTKDMLTVFSSKYGTYPFVNEKYGIYQFAFGGGMEHQTMTGQGTFQESVTAHELGHQWFGDMITCETWSDIWLNEGFATYSEALWEEFKPGSSGLTALLSAMANRRPSNFGGSVYCFVTTDPNRIFSTDYTYRKGGWVLHMLRHIVGDQNFFDSLIAYRAAHEYDTATTVDFQNVLESVSGQDLDFFFSKWLFDVGAPIYQYNWRNITAGGANYLELYLRQSQTVSWPTFTMPIDINTRVGTTDIMRQITNNARTQHFLLPVTGSVNAVGFDPFNWVLTASPTSIATFAEGPPKIVSVSPEPGAANVDPMAALSVTFHKNVTTILAHYALVNTTTSTSIPLALSYNATTFTSTLTPQVALTPGDYSLTVDDALTGVAGGLTLDGEVLNPASIASLPSGNGIAGGDAIFAFSVAAVPPPQCADANNDGLVDSADLSVLLATFGTSTANPGDGADFNDDSIVDSADLSVLLANFGVSCGV